MHILLLRLRVNKLFIALLRQDLEVLTSNFFNTNDFLEIPRGTEKHSTWQPVSKSLRAQGLPFGPARSRPVACVPRFLLPGLMLKALWVTGGFRTAGTPAPCPALAEVRSQPATSRLFPGLTSHPAACFRSLLPVCNLSQLLLPSTVSENVPGAGS